MEKRAMIYPGLPAAWVAEQRSTPEGMLVITFNDGQEVVRPMPRDSNGESYMECFANAPETWLPETGDTYHRPPSTGRGK